MPSSSSQQAVNSPHFNAGNLRREFLVTREFAYFDHASVGPIPLRGVQAANESLAAQATRGSLEHPGLHALAERARQAYASLIGADAASIAYVPNTSAGISLIASGLDWREGDEIVVPGIDFPSAVLPWKMLERFGVKIRAVPCADGKVDIQHIVNACTPRTRVVCTSWVQFSSGHRMDLARLGGHCRNRGIFLVVDGAQGVGALHLDVSALPVDALVTHGYKWLLGPQGVGWMYVTDRLANALTLSATGLRGMTPRDSYLDHSFTPRTDAAKLETGILGFHGIAGALASIELLLGFGMKNIETRIASHVEILRDGLRSAGWEVKGESSRAEFRSGILAARHPAKDVKACHAALLEAGVVTSVREGCLRISPHFYNTVEDIDRLLRLI